MGAKAMREPVTIKNIMFSGDAGSPCKLLSGGTKSAVHSRSEATWKGVILVSVCFILARYVLSARAGRGGRGVGGFTR